MMKLLRSLTPLGIRLLVGAAFLLLVAGFLVLQSCQSASTAKTESRLSKGQTGAALASGADAVETVGDTSARAAEADRLTKENSDAIRKAPGADAPVADGVHDAGLRALCKRAAYRGSQQCLQLAPAE